MTDDDKHEIHENIKVLIELRNQLAHTENALRERRTTMRESEVIMNISQLATQQRVLTVAIAHMKAKLGEDDADQKAS